MSVLNKGIKTAAMGLQQSIAYKNDFILSFLTGGIGLVVQILFWPAFFYSTANGGYSSVGNISVAGYEIDEIITYSIITYIIQRGTNMMNISDTIKSDVMSGALNAHLLRPINYIWMKWIHSFSGQLINSILSFCMYLCLMIVWKGTVVFPDNGYQLLFLFIFIILAYILSFLMYSIVGMLSFWILEIGALNSFINMGISILSGAIFPIDFIQGNMGKLLQLLPFSYLAYVPTQIYLGKLESPQLALYFAICIFWIAIMSLMAHMLWLRGLRRYSAFGG